jgi:hypothetical protein
LCDGLIARPRKKNSDYERKSRKKTVVLETSKMAASFASLPTNALAYKKKC